MATRTSQPSETLGIGLTLGVTLLWLLGVTASGLVAQHEMNEVFDSALEETIAAHPATGCHRYSEPGKW